LQIKRFRRKPCIVEAIQWDGCRETYEHILDWLDMDEQNSWIDFRGEGLHLIIYTPEGDMYAEVGDWIIKGIKCELYPCKPDIFKELYEEVENE